MNPHDDRDNEDTPRYGENFYPIYDDWDTAEDEYVNDECEMCGRAEDECTCNDPDPE